MGNIEYVCITWQVKRSYHEEPLYTRQVKLPRWLFDINLTQRRIIWINACIQYRAGTLIVNTLHHFYDLNTNADMGYNSAIKKLQAAKGNTTKWRNKLAFYKTIWKPSLFEQSIEQNANYQKLVNKIKSLELIEANLQRTIELEAHERQQ